MTEFDQWEGTAGAGRGWLHRGAGQRGAAGSGGGGKGRSRAAPGLCGGQDAGPLPGEEGEQPR